MRNGQHVRTLPAADATVDLLVAEWWAGHTRRTYPERRALRPDAPIVLDVRDLRRRDQARGVDLHVRAGEIVGPLGRVGAGRSDFAQAIFGATGRGTTGSVCVDGVEVGISSPRRALRAGIALLPESRKDEGLFLGMRQRENATSSLPAGLQRGGGRPGGAPSGGRPSRSWRDGRRSVDSGGEVGVLSGGRPAEGAVRQTSCCGDPAC